MQLHTRGSLSAARELFARKGYSGTSVREIVAAADVTKPVLYYYFRNKEGLYLEQKNLSVPSVSVVNPNGFIPPG